MRKIAELRAKRDSYLATAQRIVSSAVAEQRSLSQKEQDDVAGLREKAAAIASTLQAHDGLRDLQDAGDREHEADQQHRGAGFRQSDDGLGLGRICRALAAGRGDPERAAHHAERVYGDEQVSRALLAGTGDAGGFLVPERFSTDLIDLLRPASVVRRMGAVNVPMGSGNITLPKLTAGSAASYIGESDHIGVTQPTFGQVKASAKKLAALVPISNDLLRFSSPAADQVVTRDLVRAIATAEDAAFLRGDGLGNGPKGLRYFAPAANILKVSATVNLANVDADLNKLLLALLAADCSMTTPGWIMSPRSYVYLLGLRDSNGFRAFPEMASGQLKGYPFATTTKVPNNLAVTGTNESEIYFCDFADVMIAEVPGLLISVSSEAAYYDGSAVVSAFSRDQTVVRVIAQHDLVMRHTESIAVLSDVDWGA